jgi:hypothetical protein
MLVNYHVAAIHSEGDYSILRQSHTTPFYKVSVQTDTNAGYGQQWRLMHDTKQTAPDIALPLDFFCHHHSSRHAQ